MHFDGYADLLQRLLFHEELPFKSGTGIYLNAGVDTRLSNLQLAYWSGNGYISPLGGRLYQSVSSSPVDANYTERQRQLLILRVLRDYRLPGQVILTTRFEPLYDLNNGLFDFSFALYLNFNQSFLLSTLHPSR